MLQNKHPFNVGAYLRVRPHALVEFSLIAQHSTFFLLMCNMRQNISDLQIRKFEIFFVPLHPNYELTEIT